MGQLRRKKATNFLTFDRKNKIALQWTYDYLKKKLENSGNPGNFILNPVDLRILFEDYQENWR